MRSSTNNIYVLTHSPHTHFKVNNSRCKNNKDKIEPLQLLEGFEMAISNIESWKQTIMLYICIACCITAATPAHQPLNGCLLGSLC